VDASKKHDTPASAKHVFYFKAETKCPNPGPMGCGDEEEEDGPGATKEFPIWSLFLLLWVWGMSPCLAGAEVELR
jgi:hypothetical protein